MSRVHQADLQSRHLLSRERRLPRFVRGPDQRPVEIPLHIDGATKRHREAMSLDFR